VAVNGTALTLSRSGECLAGAIDSTVLDRRPAGTRITLEGNGVAIFRVALAP
jgi:hypothetical protein